MQIQRRKRVNEVAINLTGLGATSAGAYFVKRRSTKQSPWETIAYRRYPMFGIVTDVANHFTLTFESCRGPLPDVCQFVGLIRQTTARVKLKTVLAKAGYDSGSNHALAREEMALRTIIAPKHGRPTGNRRKENTED
ncbi:hypothetical protein OAG71_00020 [bacterium]|nr:hypothetical protein [bacterium]